MFLRSFSGPCGCSRETAQQTVQILWLGKGWRTLSVLHVKVSPKHRMTGHSHAWLQREWELLHEFQVYLSGINRIRLNSEILRYEVSIYNFFTCCVSIHGHCHVFALVERVQQCCAESFHTFSLDYLNGSITHVTGRLAYSSTSRPLFIQGHGPGNLSILLCYSYSKLKLNLIVGRNTSFVPQKKERKKSLRCSM